MADNCGRAKIEMQPVHLAAPMAAAISYLHAACFPHPWSEEDFSALINDDDVFGHVIERDGALVGCILLRQAGDEAEILTLAVAPYHRRCGVASKLMEAGHTEAQTRSITSILLEVARSNVGAHALYTRFSYKHVGIRKAYYRREKGKTEDALVMARSIVA